MNTPKLIWEHDNFRLIRIDRKYDDSHFIVEEGSDKDAMGAPVWKPVITFREVKDGARSEASLSARFNWHLLTQFEMLLKELKTWQANSRPG